MMDVPDAIIVTLGAVADKIVGRTAIQKLVYFEMVLDLVDANYRPHYYGPYSSEVMGTIQELAALGFVEEKIETRETTGYSVSDEWKRYCYKLTNDGSDFLAAVKKEDSENYDNISEVARKCGRISKFNPQILSWAAKVHYIASHEDKAMEFKEIMSNANEFGWILTEENIIIAVDLLNDLGLIKNYDEI
jgi:uncharacterized protein YwgA